MWEEDGGVRCLKVRDAAAQSMALDTVARESMLVEAVVVVVVV